MRQVHGFTIIELMVTLVVLAIALGMALPSFTNQVRDNRSLALGEEFTTALNFSRSEAVKRGRIVSLCASNNTRDDCGNDWTNGWLVFIDGAASETANSAVLADEDDILRYWDPSGDDSNLAVTNGGTNRNFVRFTSMGTLARLSNSPIVAEAHIDDCQGNSARRIQVGLSGTVHNGRMNCP